ncbi:multidrug resistance-associated protein 1 [Trichodelitschia bisporula]|uniref:Multidrug resistance-associated protein 1 n=1 Tax=Trichodelitschia bisporula TaxID=703511 RepID=A0A6G1HV50_9PEZI|nr:multidrug resistance-associated protein 1 [Trichodelitschia bisporula]
MYFVRAAALASNASLSVSLQPFCNNPEGWGPLSLTRYDFTPCFLDVPQALVALFGLLVGGITIWVLLNKCSKQPTEKDWHYYAKLVLVAGVGITTTLEGYVQVTGHTNSLGDFRFWTTVLQISSLSVIFAIHELEHERARVPSGTVLFYWLFYLLVGVIKTRSLYIQNFTKHEALFALVATNLVLATTVFILEAFVPKKQSMYRGIGDEKERPSEYSNIFEILSYSWFTPLIKRGYKTYLTEEDLWDLPERQTTKHSGDKFAAAWLKQSRTPNPSVWGALISAFGGPYVGFVPIKMTADTFSYMQPVLLRMLITFVNTYRTDNPDPPLRGFIIAFSMFAVQLVQSLCNNHFMTCVFELGQLVRAGLISEIYKKSLRLSAEGSAAKSTGDIVNLMAVDTQRISDLSRQGHQLWSSPFQITLCMISLSQLLGWPGFAGVVVMAVMIPLNAYIARLMKTYQRQQMGNKDERTRVTTEILNNIKSIKLYSWAAAFAERLSEVRNKELRMLRKIGGTQAASRFCWNTTPFLVSCGTFTLYVMVSEKPLSVELVFPALTLFNLLTQPLTQLPMVISSVVESSVAVRRIKSFFLAKEIQTDAVNRLPAATEDGADTVRVERASFTWGQDGGKKPVLSDISLSARKGQLNCIVGRVGSGKTSLLQAILGDLRKLNGDVTVCGTIAYVAQHAWITNASVKDNILFGHHYDPEYYERTIKACALTEDLAVLPDGDRTEVGEKGISLSGGQKARLQLARAVYARADIYLMDDILSAVDQHVGRHIINHVVGPKGLLRGKTRILATNSIPVLKEADHIALLSEGRITEEGTFWDAISKNGEIAALIKTVKNSSDHSGGAASSAPSPTKSSSGMDSGEESEEDLLASFAEKEDLFKKEEDRSVSRFRRSSNSSMHKSKKGDEEMALLPVVKSRQTKEISEKGKVKWNVYFEYAKACNVNAVALWVFTVVAVQSLQVGNSVWLKNWAEGNESSGGNPDIAKNVGVYFAIGIAASIMIVIQTMIMWLFCSIQASRKLHARMANAIFRSPMSFFETTPMGRILNRFSSDMFRVDEALGRSFSELFGNGAKALFTIGVICVTTPVFMAILVPLGGIYWYIQRYYLRSNRELKRLESISRSPIYAHFQESLGGLTTIRAFQQQERWSWESENRVDANLKAFFPPIYANRWLGIRLEFVGAMVVLMAAVLSILAVINGGGPSAGMVGLAMSYALQITQALSWMVRLSVEVETNIVSVERVLEYARLPSEAEEIIHNNRPLPTWPSKGNIQFNDYSMRYRPGLDLVLKNIELSLRSREKIGIVGRTGAGKSSLTLALFRIVEAASGTIVIDDIDTSAIGLDDLRSKLAIIPQDAALFAGTIRDNLDPMHSKRDDELWAALEQARLKAHVSSMPGKLDAAVQEAGSNLSQGQKQLVSLARALLTKSTILVLDEATAAVDVETDALVQETLRSDLFSDRTLITIAHRINTIIDYDRIAVLQRGEVVEFGTPQELIKAGGAFFELAREGGLVDNAGQR